jgi:hypothetical protein
MLKRLYNKKGLRYATFVVLPIWFFWSMLGLVNQGELFTSGATLALSPPQGLYGAGKVFSIDVLLFAKDPVNAAGVTLEYDQRLLEVLEVGKQGSIINLWVEEPEYLTTPGVVHFSGGMTTRNGFVGEGKLATVLFRARASGEARVNITDANVFAHDGLGTDILLHKYGGVYTIAKDGAGGIRFDLDGNGAVEMKDVGVFVEHWDGPYDAKYDLNRNKRIDIGDLVLLVFSIRVTRG